MRLLGVAAAQLAAVDPRPVWRDLVAVLRVSFLPWFALVVLGSEGSGLRFR